jgi:hypothetical protein
MHLIEIFLPLTDNNGLRFDSGLFERVRKELTERFGGVTAFVRAPAEGTFNSGGAIVHDEIVVIEVMVEDLDRRWWNSYRRELETTFAQDEIIIRASKIERL